MYIYIYIYRFFCRRRTNIMLRASRAPCFTNDNERRPAAKRRCEAIIFCETCVLQVKISVDLQRREVAKQHCSAILVFYV